MMNLHGHILNNQNLWFTLGFTVGFVQSMGLDKCIMTCIQYYSIIRSIFTALKILGAPPSHHFAPTPSPTRPSGKCFIVLIILPFSECHMIEIIQDEAFFFFF